MQPDKGCAGGRHVTVTPCPVRLTRRTKQGVVITVDAPHIASSKIGGFSSCFTSGNCYNIERLGGSQTQWLITSGQICGDALVEFHAMNDRGHRIGEYYLLVYNNYCP
jgi:hypothetical protein